MTRRQTRRNKERAIARLFKVWRIIMMIVMWWWQEDDGRHASWWSGMQTLIVIMTWYHLCHESPHLSHCLAPQPSCEPIKAPPGPPGRADTSLISCNDQRRSNFNTRQITDKLLPNISLKHSTPPLSFSHSQSQRNNVITRNQNFLFATTMVLIKYFQ